MCISVDPLGFITMGPAVTGELLVQSKKSRVGFGIYSGIRFTNLGLASNFLLSDGDMEFFSYTIPISLRIYLKTTSSTDGVFLGPHVEFGKSIYKNGYKQQTRALGIEVGYKWTYKSGFTLELGDLIGIIQTKEISDSRVSNYKPKWDDLRFVFYLLSVKLGLSL